MSAHIPDKRLVVLVSWECFLTSENTTGYIQDQCCHLQADGGPLSFSMNVRYIRCSHWRFMLKGPFETQVYSSQFDWTGSNQEKLISITCVLNYEEWTLHGWVRTDISSVIESYLDLVHRLVGSSNCSDWIGGGSFLFSWFLKQKNSLLVPGGLLVRVMGIIGTR